MSRSKQMKPVLELAENRKQQAATALGQQQQKLDQAIQQLNELIEYRAEYAESLAQNPGSQTVMQLQEQRAFMAKLSAAIKQQQHVIDQLTLQLKQLRAEWRDKHQETQALDYLVSSYEADEMKAREIKEQKSLEDLVTGKYARDSMDQQRDD